VGCILAELLTMQVESNCRPIDRKPLFPGKSCFPLTADDPLAYADAFDQLNLIFAVIGTPTIEQMARIDNPTARAYVLGLKPKNAVDLCQRYRAADPEAIDLLSKLLQFEPTQRITAVQALNHPYLTQMQDKTKLQLFEDLVDASNAVVQEFDWESNSHTREHIRQLIIQEVLIEQPVNIRSSKS
jgi:mitogen-activated protein kinase 1/3